MRLGLFGGTFDPIHLGHLILAESCREALALDRLWFVVSGVPPHKQAGRTPVTDRLEMVRLAIAGHPAFELSEIEATGPGPHYSFATLERIADQHPLDDLFFLIGADSLLDLPHWRRPDRIAELAHLVVVGRPGFTLPDPLPDLGPRSRPILPVESPLIQIASSTLRRRVSENLSIRYQVPRAVEAYIQTKSLYRS